MSSLLTNLRSAVITGFVLAFILIFFLAQGSFDQTAFNMWLLRWFHVVAAIMWVGIGSIYGALLGGFVVGIAANLAVMVLPSGYSPSMPFLIIIAVLLIRPNGLFGEERT